VHQEEGIITGSSFSGGMELASSELRRLTSADRARLVFRVVQLLLIWSPVAFMGVVYGLSILVSARYIKFERISDAVGRAFLQTLLWSISRCGAAFIKWAQWAATRDDLFSTTACNVLSQLHDGAPIHSFSRTRRAILANFGAPIESLFLSFDEAPLASGSVAQVYRAVLRPEVVTRAIAHGSGTIESQLLSSIAEGGEDLQVAVKVSHPDVARRIQDDFFLLELVADVTRAFPMLRWLRLRETLSNFSHTMGTQADLRVEAQHLHRFAFNFQGRRDRITCPYPIPGLCSREVLVETFQTGELVKSYILEQGDENFQICSLGVECYMKMLLEDNFIHSDLHPGNFLISRDASHLNLCLLDFGMAEELPAWVSKEFISFIFALAEGNGHRVADALLRWARVQECRDPGAFRREVVHLINTECQLHEGSVDLDAVIKAILRLAHSHCVTVDAEFGLLCVGMCVLVGFARQLDGETCLLEAAVPTFIAFHLTGKSLGKLYG